MPENKRKQVQKRNDNFAARTITKIWHEEPSKYNPYLAESCRCSGYDLFDLMEKRSFIDMLYLLFLGELPDSPQAKILETLMIGFINPGPRHPAARAAMNAGVGRTNTAHILPIALSVLSGSHLGASEVVDAMRFLKKHIQECPEIVSKKLLEKEHLYSEGDWHIAPGFGTRFGSIDPVPQVIAQKIFELPGSGKAMEWASSFAEELSQHGSGWLSTGVAAAVFLDLGFSPNAGAGLFQLICAPGLLAHGLEMSDKPITAMPFLDERDYIIAEEAKKRKY